MKKFPLAAGLALAAFSLVVHPALAQTPAAVPAPAPEAPAPLPAAAEAGDITNGFNVKVEVMVNEKGEIDGIGRVETDDHTTGDVLTKMAIMMASKVKMPAHEKAGHPVRYKAILPFHFPVEGDEGPAAQNQPRPVGRGDVSKQPLYPPEMAAKDEVGGAILELVIDTAGNVSRLTTLRASHPEFEAAARAAVGTWKFKPAQKDGKPVETRWRISVVFDTADKMADLRWRVTPRPSLGSWVCFFNNSAPAAAPAAQPGAATPTVQVPAPGK